jgi:hypothetical protein
MSLKLQQARAQALAAQNKRTATRLTRKKARPIINDADQDDYWPDPRMKPDTAPRRPPDVISYPAVRDGLEVALEDLDAVLKEDVTRMTDAAFLGYSSRLLGALSEAARSLDAYCEGEHRGQRCDTLLCQPTKNWLWRQTGCKRLSWSQMDRLSKQYQKRRNEVKRRLRAIADKQFD